jgi:predicted acetyltransferase
VIVEISQLQVEHLELLKNLWQFYEVESSVREQLDVDVSGRFPVPEEVFASVVQGTEGNSGYAILCDEACAGFLILSSAEIEGKAITEFADLFVLPKYRGRGVGSAVVEKVILRSSQAWLIAVFRDDMKALSFWHSAFSRLPFTSCREVVPPELPQFHEFIVNESDPSLQRSAFGDR